VASSTIANAANGRIIALDQQLQGITERTGKCELEVMEHTRLLEPVPEFKRATAVSLESHTGLLAQLETRVVSAETAVQKQQRAQTACQGVVDKVAESVGRTQESVGMKVEGMARTLKNLRTCVMDIEQNPKMDPMLVRRVQDMCVALDQMNQKSSGFQHRIARLEKTQTPPPAPAPAPVADTKGIKVQLKSLEGRFDDMLETHTALSEKLLSGDKVGKKALNVAMEQSSRIKDVKAQLKVLEDKVGNTVNLTNKVEGMLPKLSKVEGAVTKLEVRERDRRKEDREESVPRVKLEEEEKKREEEKKQRDAQRLKDVSRWRRMEDQLQQLKSMKEEASKQAASLGDVQEWKKQAEKNMCTTLSTLAMLNKHTNEKTLPKVREMLASAEASTQSSAQEKEQLSLVKVDEVTKQLETLRVELGQARLDMAKELTTKLGVWRPEWRDALEQRFEKQDQAGELLKQSQGKVVELVRKNAVNMKESLDEQAKVVGSMQGKLTPFLLNFKTQVKEVCGGDIASTVEEMTKDTVTKAAAAAEAVQQHGAQISDVASRLNQHMSTQEESAKLVQSASAAAAEAKEELGKVMETTEQLRIMQDHQRRNIDLIETKLSEQMAQSGHFTKTIDNITKHIKAPQLRTWRQKVDRKLEGNAE
jgi:hypothetical protein